MPPPVGRPPGRPRRGADGPPPPRGALHHRARLRRPEGHLALVVLDGGPPGGRVADEVAEVLARDAEVDPRLLRGRSPVDPPRLGRHPQATLGVGDQMPQRLPGGALVRDRAGVQPHQLPVDQRPEGVLAGRELARHRRQRVREHLHRAGRPSLQRTGLVRDPQRPVRRMGRDEPEPGGDGTERIPWTQHVHVDAVEAHEPVARGEPHHPVRVHRHVLDVVEGQAVVHGPPVEHPPRRDDRVLLRTDPLRPEEQQPPAQQMRHRPVGPPEGGRARADPRAPRMFLHPNPEAPVCPHANHVCPNAKT